MIVLSAVLVLFFFVILAVYAKLLNQFRKLADLNSELCKQIKLIKSQKKSSEVRLGQIAEQLAPFTNHFKYDPKKSHFLGQPIDYVIFEDDEIIFLEIKTGDARLVESQKKVKENIEQKRIRFEQIRYK